MITWQGPGVLYHKGRKFKAGDVIPAGILPESRIATLKKEKKSGGGEIKVDK